MHLSRRNSESSSIADSSLRRTLHRQASLAPSLEPGRRSPLVAGTEISASNSYDTSCTNNDTNSDVNCSSSSNSQVVQSYHTPAPSGGSIPPSPMSGSSNSYSSSSFGTPELGLLNLGSPQLRKREQRLDDLRGNPRSRAVVESMAGGGGGDLKSSIVGADGNLMRKRANSDQGLNALSNGYTPPASDPHSPPRNLCHAPVRDPFSLPHT